MSSRKERVTWLLSLVAIVDKPFVIGYNTWLLTFDKKRKSFRDCGLAPIFQSGRPTKTVVA